MVHLVYHAPKEGLTLREIEERGTLYVGAFYPFVGKDDFHDRKKRMDYYWAHLFEDYDY